MGAIIQLHQSPKWAKRSDEHEHLPPVRRPSQESRAREYLTPAEIERMLNAVRKAGGCVAERDALLVLLGYRHGLRASELTALRWDQVDLEAGRLAVTRLKKGEPSTHPVRGPELRALRAWKRAQGTSGSPYVFTSMRGAPMVRRTVHYTVAEAGRLAGIAFPVHPHTLRHGAGYYLANEGRDTRSIQLYLGHKNIQHTCRYTPLAADRFKDFWKD